MLGEGTRGCGNQRLVEKEGILRKSKMGGFHLFNFDFAILFDCLIKRLYIHEKFRFEFPWFFIRLSGGFLVRIGKRRQ